MLHLSLVYVHLLATCLAIGLLLACDLRLAARLHHRADRSAPVLVPPSRFVRRAVAGALAVLLASGAGLVVLALQARPDALANPKLQAKLVFVGVLMANAVALHGLTFPRLARGAGALADRASGLGRWAGLAAVALPVAVSHAAWGYCAFLGIARPWNFTQPFDAVVGGGLAAIAVAWVGATVALALASAEGAPRVDGGTEPDDAAWRAHPPAALPGTRTGRGLDLPAA